MKKKMLVPVLMLLGSTAFAQIKFAPEVGLNMYTQNYKVNRATNTSTTLNSKMLPGLRAGLVADIPVGSNFAVQPALYYTLNRTTIDLLNYGSLATVESNRTLHEIQLPIYFLYKSGSEGDGRFFGGVGPYFAYALAGKDHIKTTVVGFTGERDQKMTFGDDPSDHMRPFDIGGSATIGYELPMGVYVRGNYNLGLTNLLPDGDSDNSLKNMSFGVSVGYFIK